MAFDHSVTLATDGPGLQVTGAKTYSAEGNVQLFVAVAIGATELLVKIGLDVSQIKSFMMVCDQDLTFETNQVPSPDTTVALKANVPFVETTDNYYTSVFVVNFGRIFLTNASGVACTFKLSVVHDPTV